MEMEFRKVNEKTHVFRGYYASKLQEFVDSGDELWETKFDTKEERDRARHNFLNYTRAFGVRVSVNGLYLYLERL